MRMKTDISGSPTEEPVPGSAHEREVFVIENLATENGGCASHQLTIYRFSLDGTTPVDGPDAPAAAGVIDVSFWDVASADAGAEPDALAALVTRLGGDPTILGTPATGGLALLYQSRH